MQEIKVITWNVNGLKCRIRSGSLVQLLNEQRPHLLLLQEIKSSRKTIPDIVHPDYVGYWNPAVDVSSAWHGTGVLIHRSVLSDFEIKDVVFTGHPDEGRLMSVRDPRRNLTIINCYTPNSGVDRQEPLKRLDYRVTSWDPAFRAYIKALQTAGDSVIICGDLNVARNEYDVHNPKTLKNKAGFTSAERHSFEELLSECQLQDVWDCDHSLTRGPDRYTWYGLFQREKLRGWRLDYQLISLDVARISTNAEIIKNICDSDHLPLSVTYDLKKLNDIKKCAKFTQKFLIGVKEV